MLSERGQTPKTTCSITPLIRKTRKGTTMGTQSRPEVARGEQGNLTVQESQRNF